MFSQLRAFFFLSRKDHYKGGLNNFLELIGVCRSIINKNLDPPPIDYIKK